MTKTHKEYSESVQPVVPCAVWHITFGGRCLNCGWKGEPYETLLQFLPRG